MPDGNFPTASYPNPEDPQVFELALEMAKTEESRYNIWNRSRCDRIGVVVKDSDGEYKVLTGNQTGLLINSLYIKSH